MDSRIYFLCLIILSYFTASNKGNNEEDYRMMAAMTKYDAIRGDIRDIKFNANCKPIRLWMFHRHGTRHPSKREVPQIAKLVPLINDVIANHDKGKGNLTIEQLQRLKRWTFDVNMKPLILTAAGHNETRRKAARFKEKFPRLLNRKYKREDFHFQHTPNQRNTETSAAFIQKFFGEDSLNIVENIATPMLEDFLLNPLHGACPKLTEVFDTHYGPKSEDNRFLDSTAFKQATKIVSSRLGFDVALPPIYLKAIFMACGYESAWYQEFEPEAPWCAVLGLEGRLAGEYFFDVHFNDVSGYGDKIKRVTPNFKGACAIVKDIWERFATAVGYSNNSNMNQTVATFVAHDNIIFMLHSTLGLLKDEPPLSADNFEIQGNRAFRSSEVVPFAANFGAVLHECKHDDITNYEIMLFRNEKPWLGVPNCPQGVCTWLAFKDLFQPISDDCNYKEFC